MAELAVGAAAAVGGTMLKSVWDYNRDNYKYDRQMQQTAMHQRQAMRKEWMTLFRDDINQMVNLTTTRMDNYILTNSLQVGLLMAILGEGALLPSGDMPLFTTWAFTLCFVAAIVLLLLSTWLAIHASITAHSCGLSLLLQSRQVRDLPTGAEIDNTRFRLQDYELVDKSAQLRVPFARRMRQFFGGGEKGAEAAVGPQAQPYHAGVDSLENFYLNEQMEAAERRRAHERLLGQGSGGAQSTPAPGAPSGGPSSSSAAGARTGVDSNTNVGLHGRDAVNDNLYVPDSTAYHGLDPRNQNFGFGAADATGLTGRAPADRKKIQVRASHLNIFRILQKHWQYFDAYARVSSALGTYMMVAAIAYFLLTYIIAYQRYLWLAWCIAILYGFLSRAIATVDMVLVGGGPPAVLFRHIFRTFTRDEAAC